MKPETRDALGVAIVTAFIVASPALIVLASYYFQGRFW